MIYTVTLNPALDHYLEVDDLLVDDANRVKGECLFAGGKGIDVSRAIRHLGGGSIALGFLGGHNGQILMNLLQREGVTSYFTTIAQETRRNILINPVRRRRQTILNSSGPGVTHEEWEQFLTHLRALDLRGAYVVVGGSLPRGVRGDAYEQIVTLVQGRGARAVVDADGVCMRAALRAKPFAIKPNVNELRRLVGKTMGTEKELIQAAVLLNQRGVAVVMVSRGADGLLVVSEGVGYRAVPPSVKVKSTIGAGDSTVAGFVFRHAGGKNLEECARFATACGTAATLAPGNQLCHARDVQRLLTRIRLAPITLRKSRTKNRTHRRGDR